MDAVGRLHRVVAGPRLIALACLVVLAGCAEPPPPPPSEAEALALLDRIVATAMRRDFDALCAVGTSACYDFLDQAGRDAVPPQPPRVVGITRLENSRRPDGLWTSGGVLLQLCGVDGRGRPYASEMLIVRKGSVSNPGPLAASEPVYWSGMRIARDATVGGGSEPIDCSRNADRFYSGRSDRARSVLDNETEREREREC